MSVTNFKFTSGATAQELLGCFDDTINYDQFLVVTAEGTSLEERLKILLHLNCIRGKEKKPKKFQGPLQITAVRGVWAEL